MVGLGKLEKEQSPLPQHIRRIASQISPEKCHDTALELGLSESEWNDLEYQFQHQPPNDLKFTALWSCMIKRRHVTFDRLKDALKNSELSEHLLCQVRVCSYQRLYISISYKWLHLIKLYRMQY